jgi:hypothetical protein
MGAGSETREVGHDHKEGPVSGVVVPPANHRARASGLTSGHPDQANGEYAGMTRSSEPRPACTE